MFTSIKTTILNYIKPTLVQIIDPDSLNVDTLNVSLDGTILIHHVVRIFVVFLEQYIDVNGGESQMSNEVGAATEFCRVFLTRIPIESEH